MIHIEFRFGKFPTTVVAEPWSQLVAPPLTALKLPGLFSLFLNMFAGSRLKIKVLHVWRSVSPSEAGANKKRGPPPEGPLSLALATYPLSKDFSDPGPLKSQLGTSFMKVISHCHPCFFALENTTDF